WPPVAALLTPAPRTRPACARPGARRRPRRRSRPAAAVEHHLCRLHRPSPERVPVGRPQVPGLPDRRPDNTPLTHIGRRVCCEERMRTHLRRLPPWAACWAGGAPELCLRRPGPRTLRPGLV